MGADRLSVPGHFPASQVIPGLGRTPSGNFQLISESNVNDGTQHNEVSTPKETASEMDREMFKYPIRQRRGFLQMKKARHGTFWIPGIKYNYHNFGRMMLKTECVNYGQFYNCTHKFGSKEKHRNRCWAGCGKIFCKNCCPKIKPQSDMICKTCNELWQDHIKR